MKKIVVPNNINNIDEFIKIGADAFIFALKDFSIGYNNYLNIEEIKEITKKYKDIEFFVSINKNIFNHELKELEKILIELNILNIKGILFYDIALIELKNKLNLTVGLVWNQNYMVTNYNTCNYYFDKGVKYGVLSEEITIEEMLEIKDKTKMSLMTHILYNPLVSITKRKLLTNYFKDINEEFDGNIKTLKEKDKEYIIKEEKEGNSIFCKDIVNGYEAYKILKNKIDYVIFNQDFMDEENFLTLFKNFMDENEDAIEKQIGKYDGFFYTRTIYKVR